MRFLALLLACGLGLSLCSVGVPTLVRRQFSEWAKEQGRTYKSVEEQESRMANFYANLLKVAQLNQAGAHLKEGAVFKLNKYGDWSEEEQRMLRGFRIKNADTGDYQVANISAQAIPAKFDWRPKKVIADVQDQQQCGSCWAFSTTSNVESVNAIKSGQPVKKLSEQYLVDCDHTCGTYRFETGCDSGCNGGLQPSAFKYIKAHGQPSEDSYPYQGSSGTCDSTQKPVSKVAGWEFVPQDEEKIAAYVATKAPVSVAVDASSWSFYTGGIMSSSDICQPVTDPANQLDHAVNIVGYGEEAGTKYWIIRNSWNADWGEDGYCRILRGTGFCGVNLFACSALM